ncbi:MAG: GGDEF domain-containing protein, partial [bacterium]
ARAIRYHTTFSLAIFDIDDFKKINDTYGHECGDEVLIKVASMLKSASRATDIVARYGGEEFLIIFPNTEKTEAHY